MGLLEGLDWLRLVGLVPDYGEHIMYVDGGLTVVLVTTVYMYNFHIGFETRRCCSKILKNVRELLGVVIMV